MRNQKAYEEILKKMTSCPLCDPERYDNIVVEKGSLAMVIKNKFPYCENHLLIFPTRHEKLISGLTGDEWREINKLLSKYSIDGSELYIKNGGDSLEHLHFHLIIPEKQKGFIYSSKTKAKIRR